MHVLPDRRGQACSVDRLGQELGRPERDGDAAIGKHGDDDDRDLGEIGIGFERRQHRPAIQSRHQHVERDRRRGATRAPAQARFAVRHLDHAIALPAHRGSEEVAGVRIVVDDHDERRMFGALRTSRRPRGSQRQLARHGRDRAM